MKPWPGVKFPASPVSLCGCLCATLNCVGFRRSFPSFMFQQEKNHKATICLYTAEQGKVKTVWTEKSLYWHTAKEKKDSMDWQRPNHSLFYLFSALTSLLFRTQYWSFKAEKDASIFLTKGWTSHSRMKVCRNVSSPQQCVCVWMWLWKVTFTHTFIGCRQRHQHPPVTMFMTGCFVWWSMTLTAHLLVKAEYRCATEFCSRNKFIQVKRIILNRWCLLLFHILNNYHFMLLPLKNGLDIQRFLKPSLDGKFSSESVEKESHR